MESTINNNTDCQTSVHEFADKQSAVDSQGFLLDFDQWTEDFAVDVSREIGMSNGLTKEHWDIIFSVRRAFTADGCCPSACDICKANQISVNRFLTLFPAGYTHGVCRLAGITYKDAFKRYSGEECDSCDALCSPGEKTYNVDVRGFLIDAESWEPEFAFFRAYATHLPGGLTDRHWQIIYYLRECFEETGEVPSIFQTCEANGITSAQMAELFPDGFHRSAMKIAGLRDSWMHIGTCPEHL